MNEVTRAQDLLGNDVYDRDGTRVGRVGNVYVDDETHQPEWVTVRTGPLRLKESFVPLTGSTTGGGRIDIDVAGEKVRQAPRVDVEYGHLSDEQGRDLYTHYGVRMPSKPSGQRDSDDEQATRPVEAMTTSETGRHHRHESTPPHNRVTETGECSGEGRHHKQD